MPTPSMEVPTAHAHAAIMRSRCSHIMLIHLSRYARSLGLLSMLKSADGGMPMPPCQSPRNRATI